MKLTLPYPPSANASYRAIVRGKFPQVIQSRQLREFKAAVLSASIRQGSVKLAGELAVTIRLFRPQKRGDIDNRIKPTLDALNGVAFADDSQIKQLAVVMFDDKANPRAEVYVEQVKPDGRIQ